MPEASRLAGLALALTLTLLASSTSSAGTLPESAVRDAMKSAETLLAHSGVSVPGYALSVPPQVEEVSAAHLYLQGNDGAWIDGHIYLSEDAIADCRSLTLLHEIVHDATVKFRLFRGVPNSQVRDMVEALADHITAEAAQSPWRPRCLARREFGISLTELANLAVR